MIGLKKENIAKFSNRTYIFSINVISFLKSLKKSSIENENTSYLAQNIGLLSEITLDLEDLNDLNEIIASLKKTSNFANKILDNLRSISCKKELLNEKSDLQVEIYSIIQEINDLISNFETNK